MSRLLVAATTLLVAVPLSLAAAPARALEDGDHSGTSAQSANPADDLVGASDDSADADHVLVKFAAGTSGAQQMAVVDAADAALDGDVGSTGYVQLAVGDHDPVEVAAELAGVGRRRRRPGRPRPDHQPVAVRPARPLVGHLLRPDPAAAGVGRVLWATASSWPSWTGVEATHEDLVGGVLPGIDLVDHDDDADDPAGSGTVMAGIIAASADNGVGSAGVAPQAMILPVRVVRPRWDERRLGRGGGHRVGGGPRRRHRRPVDVGRRAEPRAARRDQGCRCGRSPRRRTGRRHGDGCAGVSRPAHAPEVAGLISVTATDNDGRLAPLRRWGDTVSLAAPGVSLYGPVPTWGYTTGDGSWYAAPVVAGVAALVLAREDLSPAERSAARAHRQRRGSARGRPVLRVRAHRCCGRRHRV